MKKMLLSAIAALLLVAGFAAAAPVRDWRDLDAVHNKVAESIRDMERARKANHYDMDGHGVKAEELLRQAERELTLAIDSAKKAK